VLVNVFLLKPIDSFNVIVLRSCCKSPGTDGRTNQEKGFRSLFKPGGKKYPIKMIENQPFWAAGRTGNNFYHFRIKAFFPYF